MSGSHRDTEEQREEKKDELKEEVTGLTPPNDKSFLNGSSPLIKVRKRTGSGSSSSLPVLKKGKKDKEEEAPLLSPKKGSPRDGSPRRESPRVHVLWQSGGYSSRSSSPSSSPRIEYGAEYNINPLPISEDEMNEYLEFAKAYIKKKEKKGDIYSHPDAKGATGFYLDLSATKKAVDDNKRKYGIIITRTELPSSDKKSEGWRYYLIEKIYLFVDESKKKGYEEKEIVDRSAQLGMGNEGRVVFAWDLERRQVGEELLYERVAAKIHHLKSSAQAALNEQLVLAKLNQFYGRFDYVYVDDDKDEEQIKRLKADMQTKVHKKIIFMRLLPGRKMTDVLYVQDRTKAEHDKERYEKKIDYSPLVRLKMCRQFIKAACVLQSKGITHRDLKPDNALMRENQEVCFTDFSSAKFTSEITGKESIAGTFPFVPPEAYKGLLKDVSNFGVMDNYSVAISLLEILTSENFRAKVIELSHDREEPCLATKELFTLTPDLFFDRVAEFEERLQQLIEGHVGKLDVSMDRMLQDLIYKSNGRGKFIKIILALFKTNPNERMSLQEALLEWGKIETELMDTYQAFKDILKAKAFLSKKISPDLINKSTDKMVEMERREGAYAGRRASLGSSRLAADPSFSESEKKSADDESSPSASSDSSPPTSGVRY